MIQANILVDKDGTPRIAGFGSGYILPHSVGKTAKMRTERHFRNRTPEPTRPGISPHAINATPPTKSNDVYAFGTVAFEVRTGPFGRYFLVRLLGADTYGATTSVLRVTRNRGKVLGAEWPQTITTRPPRCHKLCLGDDPELLEPSGVEAYANREGSYSFGGGAKPDLPSKRLKNVLERNVVSLLTVVGGNSVVCSHVQLLYTIYM